MTNADWLAGVEPWTMLDLVEPRASRRKLVLFSAACCRRAWPLSTEAMQPVVKLLSQRAESDPGAFRLMTAATRHLSGRGSARYAASFAARGLAYLQGEEESPPWLDALQAELTYLRDTIVSLKIG